MKHKTKHHKMMNIKGTEAFEAWRLLIVVFVHVTIWLPRTLWKCVLKFKKQTQHLKKKAMYVVYYVASPGGKIIETTGAPTKIGCKRLYLSKPGKLLANSKTESLWRAKKREGFKIVQQLGLFD